MKRAVLFLALAVAVLMAGCAPKAKPGPIAVPPTPPATPTTVGATRYAQGPGLVVEGYTLLKKIRVELQGPATQVQVDVTPKDDGWYRVTWPAPEGSAEVVVFDTSGKELVRGALSPDINVGLFYGGNVSAARVDVVDPKAMTTLMLQGQVKTSEGKAWVELRDGETVLATHEVPLEANGKLNAKLPMAPGARTVWILTRGGQAEVGIPIVTH